MRADRTGSCDRRLAALLREDARGSQEVDLKDVPREYRQGTESNLEGGGAMTMRRFLRPGLVAALLVVAACASGSGESGETTQAGARGDVAIDVNNDLIPPASITVFIVPETGSRRRLGSVGPGGRETFSYLPAVASMDHRLVAEVPGQRNSQTIPFTLSGVSGVSWDVSNTTVRTRRAP